MKHFISLMKINTVEYDILEKYMKYNWYNKMGYSIASCVYT